MIIQFTLERTELLVQESTRCRLNIRNMGMRAMNIPNPELHHEWPVFRVIGPETDQVAEFRPLEMWKKRGIVPIADDPTAGPERKLAPGDTLTFAFSLLDRVDLPQAGEYEITVNIAVGDGILSSKRVRIVVLESVPVSFDYVYSHGGVSPLLYSVETHAVPGGGIVLFRGLDLLSEFRQTLSFRIAKAPVDVQPAVSISPHGRPWPDHWVAWLSGSHLFAAYATRETVVDTVRQTPIKLGNPMLLRPLLMDTANRTGHVLLWSDDVDGGTIHRFLITDKIAKGSKLIVGVNRPLWAQLFYYSSGMRRLLLLSPNNGGIELNMANWLDGSGMRRSIDTIHWYGGHVVTGAAMDAEENIHGGTIYWTAPGDALRNLYLNHWKVIANGQIAMGKDVAINLLESVRIENAILRVNEVGQPYTLLNCDEGKKRYWLYVLPDGTVHRLPKAAKLSVGPPDFVFLDGMAPILLFHHSAKGLQYAPIGFELMGPEQL